MFMRLCTSLPLCLAAAAALVPVSSGAAHGDTASCTAPGGRAFPLTTRIHGGPGSYEAGGGYGTWYIDLTNTTGRTCTGVHPVVVLVDEKRTLKPSQPQLDFYEGSRARPVTFTGTDAQELVGVLDAEGFDGFTVAPGKTVTVKVRLSLTSDATPDQVTANAAVVQRRGDDGEWVGESNAYRFGIDEEKEEDEGEEEGDTQDAQEDMQEAAGVPTAVSTSAPPTATATTPAPTAAADDVPDPSLPLAQAQDAGERARELARTGPGLAHGLLAAVAAVLTVTTGAFLLSRSRR
ncbi:hypothetical protein [Streptomyces sp. NPDC046727]|uniref:hypothetical protein n=1 Tax=Streptomyces sp. NPDC046727 TaxID=3155373 RepID=UPI0033C26FC1